jgi:hypothetical protein
MKMKQFVELIGADDDEYIAFDRVKNPPHPCPDVSAFILLNKLAPLDPGRDAVSWAEHDEIGLAFDPEVVAKAATDEDVLTLKRCGVRYDDDSEMFKMFV